MLASLREFFDRRLGTPAAACNPHTIELATAALLIEVARTDREILPVERTAMAIAVRDKFALAEEDANELVRLAEDEAHRATDTYQFTSLINRHFSAEQKERVIELLWRVAYADGRLDVHESHVIRKIADLVHVPHGAYIAAKMRARDGAPPRPFTRED
jgi:uncharacterized tellurite resistance protein B-like protein